MQGLSCFKHVLVKILAAFICAKLNALMHV